MPKSDGGIVARTGGLLGLLPSVGRTSSVSRGWHSASTAARAQEATALINHLDDLWSRLSAASRPNSRAAARLTRDTWFASAGPSRWTTTSILTSHEDLGTTQLHGDWHHHNASKRTRPARSLDSNRSLGNDRRRSAAPAKRTAGGRPPRKTFSEPPGGAAKRPSGKTNLKKGRLQPPRRSGRAPQARSSEARRHDTANWTLALFTSTSRNQISIARNDHGAKSLSDGSVLRAIPNREHSGGMVTLGPRNCPHGESSNRLTLPRRIPACSGEAGTIRNASDTRCRHQMAEGGPPRPASRRGSPAAAVRVGRHGEPSGRRTG